MCRRIESPKDEYLVPHVFRERNLCVYTLFPAKKPLTFYSRIQTRNSVTRIPLCPYLCCSPCACMLVCHTDTCLQTFIILPLTGAHNQTFVKLTLGVTYLYWLFQRGRRSTTCPPLPPWRGSVWAPWVTCSLSPMRSVPWRTPEQRVNSRWEFRLWLFAGFLAQLMHWPPELNCIFNRSFTVKKK